MLEFLDGTDLHNTLRLLLKGGAKKILVVEGEDDCNLLLEALESTDVVLVPGYGKPSTLQAAAEAATEGTEPVRFLVDADFDRLTGVAGTYPPNVFATENYDLAMDAVEHMPSIVRRIARLASGQAGPETIDVDAQVALTFRVAEEFGAIRYASHAQKWNLSFDGFPFHMYLLTQGSGAMPLPDVVALLVTRTKVCAHDPVALCEHIPVHQATVDNARTLVNSHDLFDILLHVGRKLGGAKSSTGYETQFVLAAAGSLEQVPVVSHLLEWAHAA